MSIRTRFSIAAGGLLTAAAGLVALGAATGANNRAFLMVETLRECGDRYQAAKTSGELNGQSWGEFFKACHASLIAPSKIAHPVVEAAEAAPAAPAPVAATEAIAPARTQTVAQPTAAPRLPALAVKNSIVATDRTTAHGFSIGGWKPRHTDPKAQGYRKNDPSSATLVRYQRSSDKRSTAGSQ